MKSLRCTYARQTNDSDSEYGDRQTASRRSSRVHGPCALNDYRHHIELEVEEDCSMCWKNITASAPSDTVILPKSRSHDLGATDGELDVVMLKFGPGS